MSDGCGKTCGCPSGAVLYGGSCCTPSCPSRRQRGRQVRRLRRDLRLPDGRDGRTWAPAARRTARRTAAAPACPTAAARPAAARAARCSTAAAAARRAAPTTAPAAAATAAAACAAAPAAASARTGCARRRPARRPAAAARPATTATCVAALLQTTGSAAAAAAAARGGGIALGIGAMWARVRGGAVRPASLRWRWRSVAALLASCSFLAASQQGQPSSGTKTPPVTITTCGATCSDFPSTPIIAGGAPGNAAVDVQRHRQRAGPCITEPENGTLLPNNWLRPRVKVSAPGATLLEIRFHAPKEANDLVVYTADDNWAMDKTIWLNLAAHVVDQPITVTVRTLGSAGPSAPSTVDLLDRAGRRRRHRWSTGRCAASTPRTPPTRSSTASASVTRTSSPS